MASSSTVVKLHLKILYSLSSSDNSSSNYILARHRPIPVSVFYENVGGQGEQKYATAPLRACLNAICLSSPELLSNPAIDNSVYARDPLEALPTPLSSDGALTSPASGVSVGMGLMKQFLRQEASDVDSLEGEVSVTGRVIEDRAVGGEVVEVVISLRENHSSFYGPQSGPYIQVSYSHPPGTGTLQYGTSPIPSSVCGTTTRRPPTHDFKRKPSKRTPLGSSSSAPALVRSSSVEKRINAEATADKKKKTSEPDKFQFNEETLKEVAALLAQVDDPLQQATITALLSATASMSLPVIPSSTASSSTARPTTQPSASQRLFTAPPISTQIRGSLFPKASTLKRKKSKKDASIAIERVHRAANLYYPHLTAVSDSILPSSDPPIPPSSPTPASKDTTQYYRLWDGEKPDNRSYYRQDFEASDQNNSSSSLCLPVRENSSAESSKTPSLHGSSSSSSSTSSSATDKANHPSSDPTHETLSKKRKSDKVDENVNPLEKEALKQASEKRHKHSDSKDSQSTTSSSKSSRSTLGAKNTDITDTRPRTPPPRELPVEGTPLFTPKTPQRGKNDDKGSCSTPSPSKAPSALLCTPRASKLPSTGFTPATPVSTSRIFSPLLEGDQSNIGTYIPMTPSSGAKLARAFLFEDAGVDVGWANSDSHLSTLNPTKNVSGTPSIEGVLGNAWASVAAFNSNRWSDLPPSSPPPASSPSQRFSSDLDFDVDSFDAAFNSEQDEGTTPPTSFATDEEYGSGFCKTVDGRQDTMPVESDSLGTIDPFELFSSLGLSFPLENRGSSDPILPSAPLGHDSTSYMDPLTVTEGMRELISGCVL